MANLNIKLVKSLNGRIAKHKATAEALGLRHIGDTTVQPDNEATRGKIAHIGYSATPPYSPTTRPPAARSPTSATCCR